MTTVAKRLKYTVLLPKHLPHSDIVKHVTRLSKFCFSQKISMMKADRSTANTVAPDSVEYAIQEFDKHRKLFIQNVPPVSHQVRLSFR